MDLYCVREGPLPEKFVSIAAGNRHTCGLLADGRARCWGRKTSLYPYTGAASNLTSSNFVEIDASDDITCGLRADGGIYCWDEARLLPGGYLTVWAQPRPFEQGIFRAVTTGASKVCAIDEDHRVGCWNRYRWEEPGTVDRFDEPADSQFLAIDAGAAHICGLRDNRSIRCWGNNDAGQLDAPTERSFAHIAAGTAHTCALNTQGAAVCWGDDSFGQSSPPDEARFSSLSAGELHTCGLLPEGIALCWGSDIDGQVSPPHDVAFAKISAGAHHTCGLTTTGEARCWGSDAYGQSTPPPALARFTRLFTDWDDGGSGGPVHSCGLRLDGLAQCWGEGQDPSSPVLGGARLAEIAIGNRLACGLFHDGKAACWRYYLGYPDPRLDAVVANVPVEFTFSSIVIIADRACGLTSERSILCWGTRQNWLSQDLPSPPSGTHIAIASSESFACAINDAGRIRCWDNAYGFPDDLEQMVRPHRGTTSIGEHFSPNETISRKYRALALGDGGWYSSGGSERSPYHACALLETGTAVCWGADDFGQASPPTDVRFSSITAGGRHTCGVTLAGPTRCWGADDAGQSTPPTREPLADLQANHDSTCGLRTDGDVICWGDHGLSTPAQLVPFVVNLPEQHFTDIMALDRLGIFDGTECSTQRFCTEAQLTRATLAVWLDRLLQHETPSVVAESAASIDFDDVPAEVWWAIHAQRLLGIQVMEPCDATAQLFCPSDRIPRAEFEQTLVHALESHPHDGTRSVPAAALANARAAISEDVLGMCIDREPRMCQQTAMTRGQAATLLNRFRKHIERLTRPDFTSVSANSEGGCGRRSNGTVECWGEDGTGEAYVSTDDRVLDVYYDGHFWCGRTVSHEPTCHGWDGYNYSHAPDAVGIARRTEVAFGSVYACGIESDKTLSCVGGVPTDGSPMPYEVAAPATSLSGLFDAVAVGYLHGCALRLDGSPVCWGKNEFGEASPPADGRFSHLALGASHSCGLRLNGSVKCWGYNADGRSSAPSLRLVTPSALVGPAAGILGSVQASPVPMKAIAATDVATCGLTVAGLVVCWGTSSSRAFKTDVDDWWSAQSHTLGPPTDIEGQVFASIAGLESYFCAERHDGSARCWGAHSFRRSLDSDARFIDVSASDSFTCGRRTDDTVQCWNSSTLLTVTEGLETITTASTYACGRTGDGTQSCWKLDPGHEVPDEATAGDFAQLSDSDHHTCALTSHGAVDCWGRNDAGESTPPLGSSYIQIAAGGLEGSIAGDVHYHAHSCGVEKSGTLDCWGDDHFGQSTPPAGGDFVKVAASGIHACALRADGEITCWGWGYNDGRAPLDSSRYVDVVVGAGGGFWFPFENDDGEIVHSAHTCGLRIDGIVDCWGNTYSPNKPYNRSEPDPRSRFTSISSGRSHVCGVRTDGAIECWGIPAFVAY